jgi:TIR domain
MKQSKQLRIFLLYARRDENAVRRLYRRLLKEGADVWWDQEKLLPGQDWALEIHKAIQRSDGVVVCLSKQFNKQGGFRHEELRIALEKAASLSEGESFLIPARLDPCDLPEPLRRWQRVDLFEADGYKKLIGVLKRWTAAP